jgi:putative tryptophan/tyrosine transport system substrate-binding protein
MVGNAASSRMQRFAAWIGGALLSVSPLSGLADSGKARVAVLVSYDAAPYQDALGGLKQHLAGSGMDPAIDVYPLQGNGGAAATAMQKARRDGASLIVAMGQLATQAALSGEPQLPVVAAMVLSADVVRPAANATAVTLEMPLDTQFDWMQKMLPEHRKIGLLYNPKENQQRVDAAARIARARGLKLVAEPLDSPQDLPAALERLARQIDVLWSITDQVVMSAQTAQPLLLFSFRNRIPFVGLSASWVKAGALYSLDWDYLDVGRQAGGIVERLLRGDKVQEMRPVSARKLTYTVNLKSAQQMRVSLPLALVQGARQAFE